LKWLLPAVSASFPGGVFLRCRRRGKSLLSLAPKCVLFVEEPAMVRNQIERWWNKVEQRTTATRPWARSSRRKTSICGLKCCRRSIDAHMGSISDQLGVVDILDDDSTALARLS